LSGRLAVEAVLCDVDGVVRHWDPGGMTGLDRAYGLPEGTLAATAFAPDRLLPAITGRATDQQWRAAVAADLAEACGSAKRARALVDAWNSLQGKVDQAVREILAALRGKVPVGLVSNATTRLEEDLDKLNLFGLVDFVISSARVGVAKPDADVYLKAAQRAGVPAGRCLFVDDTARNVAGAHAVGMMGLHYRNVDDLRSAVSALLG
jgi:putative hydrolase of the HAD superfamily